MTPDPVMAIGFGARATGSGAQDEPERRALAARAAELERQVRTLEEAVGSNRRIGAAVGVLMALHRESYDDAFGRLAAASRASQRKLRDVAEYVLLTGSTEQRAAPLQPAGRRPARAARVSGAAAARPSASHRR
jgi:hypothetical protein